MKADLVIRNARVVRHDGEFHGGVAVRDGKIVATGADDSLPEAARVIDAEGLVLMPGLIDPHCHLGVKYPYAEDMRTETAAAASGGVTTAILYIRNLKPSYLPFYEERKAVGEENSIIDFGFHFGIQREEHIAEIPEVIAKTGVRSFKCYFGYEPDNPIGIVPATDGWVYAAMRTLSKVPGGVINVHCENTQIATWMKNEMIATGRQDLGAYTESRPAFCEVETIRRMIFLAERTGCSLHLVHTSVGMGPVLAAEARARGVQVTVETCPHYLTRTAYDAGPRHARKDLAAATRQGGAGRALARHPQRLGLQPGDGSRAIPTEEGRGLVDGASGSRLLSLGAFPDAALRRSPTGPAVVEPGPAEFDEPGAEIRSVAEKGQHRGWLRRGLGAGGSR